MDHFSQEHDNSYQYEEKKSMGSIKGNIKKSPSAKSVSFKNLISGESVIDDFFKNVKPL